MAARPPTKARARTAWDVGRSGDAPPEWISGNADLLAAYDQGLAAHEDAVAKAKAPAPEPAPFETIPTRSEEDRAPGRDRQPSAPSEPPSPLPSGGTPAWLSRPVGGGDGTGLLLGVVAYAVLLNFIRKGPQGVKDWANAKFLNKTTITDQGGSW